MRTRERISALAAAWWRACRLRPDLRAMLFAFAAAALAIVVSNAVNPILQAPGNFWAPFLLIGAVKTAALSSRSPARSAQVAVSRPATSSDPAPHG